ncbi:unnamed protein product, partial [Sphacelaria rigidula]
RKTSGHHLSTLPALFTSRRARGRYAQDRPQLECEELRELQTRPRVQRCRSGAVHESPMSKSKPSCENIRSNMRRRHKFDFLSAPKQETNADQVVNRQVDMVPIEQVDTPAALTVNS